MPGSNLDVVRRTVIDTVHSCTAPGVGRRRQRVDLPPALRQRGVSVSWFVEINGQTVAFVAIVTGLGDEVIVRAARRWQQVRVRRVILDRSA